MSVCAVLFEISVPSTRCVYLFDYYYYYYYYYYNYYYYWDDCQYITIKHYYPKYLNPLGHAHTHTHTHIICVQEPILSKYVSSDNEGRGLYDNSQPLTYSCIEIEIFI